MRAGLVRALASAVSRVADALDNGARLQIRLKETLVDDDWRLPQELRSEHEDRPLASEWQRFDRCAAALSAVGTSQQSTIVQVADAYRDLAGAAVELAGKLENAAQHPGAGNVVVGSFCGAANNDSASGP